MYAFLGNLEVGTGTPEIMSPVNILVLVSSFPRVTRAGLLLVDLGFFTFTLAPGTKFLQ